MDNKCLQQGENFKYLDCGISCGNDKGVPLKLAKFSEILGILNNIFKRSSVQKFSRMKVCNALAVPNYMAAKFGPQKEKG